MLSHAIFSSTCGFLLNALSLGIITAFSSSLSFTCLQTACVDECELAQLYV